MACKIGLIHTDVYIKAKDTPTRMIDIITIDLFVFSMIRCFVLFGEIITNDIKTENPTVAKKVKTARK